MPKILARLIYQLMADGMTQARASAIAISQLQKSGDLKPGTTVATAKGITRGNMTPAQRAIDRKVKSNGGKPSDYKYNPINNSAVKGKINRNVKKKV
jgi:hypothetical protein